MWQINKRRLRKAIRLRDSGQEPHVSDNTLFQLCDPPQSLNLRQPRVPQSLRPGSNAERVLQLLRTSPLTVSELARELQLEKRSIQLAIDRVRLAGWWIECDGIEPQGRFYFVPITAAA